MRFFNSPPQKTIRTPMTKKTNENHLNPISGGAGPHALETNGNEPQLIALTVRVDLRELQLSDNRFTLDTYTARNACVKRTYDPQCAR